MGDGLLKTEFVDNGLAVVLDIPESNTDVAGETNVKGPSLAEKSTFRNSGHGYNKGKHTIHST